MSAPFSSPGPDEAEVRELAPQGAATAPPSMALAPADAQTLRSGEISAQALAAANRAEVEARTFLALSRPRDWMDVRNKLLKECRRYRFAGTARYKLPRAGKEIVGWTIRFAEVALRCMTNVYAPKRIIWDDDEKRVVRVDCTDLEANIGFPVEVVIPKTMVRKSIPAGVVPLRVTVKANGEKNYVLPATDDELLNAENRLVSKALRTAALRLIPGDILDECLEVCVETVKAGDKADPEAALKQITTAFFDFGVKAAELEEFLGHPLAQRVEGDIDELRRLYVAIREGDVTMEDALLARAEAAGAKKAAAEPKKKSTLRDRVAQATNTAPATAEPTDAPMREPGED